MTKLTLFRNSAIQNKRPVATCLLVVCLAVMGITGCKPSYEDSHTEAPAVPAIPANIDTEVRKNAEEFTEQLKSGKFTEASGLFSSDLQKKMSVDALTKATKSGPFTPLVSAGQLRYEDSQLNNKGDRATLRVAFDTSEQKNYRMNFIFEKGDSGWKIDTIVPPTKHRKPVTAEGATSPSQ